MRYAVRRLDTVEYATCTGYDPIEARITFDHDSRFTKSLVKVGMVTGDIAVNSSPPIIIHPNEKNHIYVKVDNWFCCKKKDLIMVQQCTDIVDGKPVFDNDPNNMQVAYKDLHEIKLNSWLILNNSFYKVVSPIKLKNDFRVISKIRFI